MTQIPPIEDAYIDSIIKSGGAYQPSLTKTQGVKLRELVKLLRDRFEQEITTLPAIIGVKAQNFRLSRVYITDNFGGQANAVSISAGELIHFEYSNADEQNVWQLQPLVHGGLAPEVLYYVYCKCSKTDQSATYIVTTEEIKPEDEPGFYMFLAGVLYPALDGYRDSDFTNGVADITGGRIKIGKIMSRDGQTGFDLDNGTIFGKISFRDIAGSLKEIKEVDAVAAKALKDAANAQISATTANTLLANVADDNLLMPAEKQDVLKEWQIIQSEKSVLIAQAATYTVAVADFDLAYSNLNTYISPLLLSMTTNSTIVGTTLRNNFKSYYDAKIALLKAVSDKAKQLSDAAQSTATGAQTSANNAQISANTAIALLADIANDNLLTPSEKPDLLKEWQIIQGEKPIITAQGAVYSIATTTYDNSYNALNIYITPLLSSLTTNSNVVGATFRTTFKTYYDAKVSLLKLVSDKAKQVIDSAQSDASAAITNAANAQVSASNAQTSSNTANQLLADIANDNLVTPSEKPDILKEWQMIQSEKLVVNASAGTYLLSTSIFDIAYNNLSTYVMPILANMVVNTIVVGATLRANFKAYYDAKIALLKLVSDSAKTLVDNIQVGGRNYFKKTTTIANGTNMPVGVAPGGINIKNDFGLLEAVPRRLLD